MLCGSDRKSIVFSFARADKMYVQSESRQNRCTERSRYCLWNSTRSMVFTSNSSAATARVGRKTSQLRPE